MANKFWVGGSGTWNTSDTTHWSTYSGGPGRGEIPPTSLDNVFFDANSGGGTVSVNDLVDTLNLNFTGFTGTLAGGSPINVYGSLTYGSGMTLTKTGEVSFNATSGTNTFTTNGLTITHPIAIKCLGSTLVLSDNITSSSSIIYASGTFNTNNKNITCVGLTTDVDYPGAKVLNLGSSIITANGNTSNNNFCFTSPPGLLTINPGTSTLKASPTLSSDFVGNGLTFYNLETNGNIEITGSSTFNNLTVNAPTTITGSNFFNTLTVNAPTTITGSNTFNDIKVNAGKTLSFKAGTTQNIDSLTSGGTSGSKATIQSLTSGSSFGLNKAGGTVNVKYLNVKDSSASGNFFYADATCTDLGGNTGWYFYPNLPEGFYNPYVAEQVGNYTYLVYLDGSIYRNTTTNQKGVIRSRILDAKDAHRNKFIQKIELECDELSGNTLSLRIKNLEDNVWVEIIRDASVGQYFEMYTDVDGHAFTPFKEIEYEIVGTGTPRSVKITYEYGEQ